MSSVKIHVRYNSKIPGFEWRLDDVPSLDFQAIAGSEFGPVGATTVTTYRFRRSDVSSFDVEYRFTVGSIIREGSLPIVDDPTSEPKLELNVDHPGFPVEFRHRVSATTTVTYNGRFKLAKNGGGDDEDPPPSEPQRSRVGAGSRSRDRSC